MKNKIRIKIRWYNGVDYYDPGGRRIIELIAEDGNVIKMIRQPFHDYEYNHAANGKWQR